MPEIYTIIAFLVRGLSPTWDQYPICEVCDKAKACDVHHILGRLGRLLLDPFNLIFICRECHEKHIWGRRKKQELLAVVRSKVIPGIIDKIQVLLSDYYNSPDE